MRLCMDQGDALSPNWLVLKTLIGTQGYCLIPIKSTFVLLTTTNHPHPWLATLPPIHPSCAGNPSTGNKSPVSMLVTSLGLPPIWLILILWLIWCNLSHGVVVDTSDSIVLDLPTMLAWSYPSWEGEHRSSWWVSLVHEPDQGRWSTPMAWWTMWLTNLVKKHGWQPRLVDMVDMIKGPGQCWVRLWVRLG